LGFPGPSTHRRGRAGTRLEGRKEGRRGLFYLFKHVEFTIQTVRHVLQVRYQTLPEVGKMELPKSV
jgi:hypothetical protein